jgi:AcrR family transcriptional regulator
MRALPLAKRAYRQGARAAAAEQTGARIIEAFQRRMREDWFDQITLEEIATEAEVTVPTIIRRFGSKEGLLQAAWESFSDDVQARRASPPGDAMGAVRVVVEDYEIMGDLVVRALAQEDRFPSLKAANNAGRSGHRAWVERCFSPWLDHLPMTERRLRVDALVTATDVYVWKLVRRDMGRSAQHLKAVMLKLIEGVIGKRMKPGATESKRG